MLNLPSETQAEALAQARAELAEERLRLTAAVNAARQELGRVDAALVAADVAGDHETLEAVIEALAQERDAAQQEAARLRAVVAAAREVVNELVEQADASGGLSFGLQQAGYELIHRLGVLDVAEAPR